MSNNNDGNEGKKRKREAVEPLAIAGDVVKKFGFNNLLPHPEKAVKSLTGFLSRHPDFPDENKMKKAAEQELHVMLIKELKQQNEEQQQQNEKQQQKLKQQNEKLKQQNEEQQQQNEEQQQKLKQQNKELKQENEELKKPTLGRLIDLHDEEAATEDVASQRKTLRLSKALGASDYSHTNTGHAEAESERKVFTVDPITYTKGEERGNDVRLAPSTILSCVNWPLPYHNEPDVQKFVGLVLDDAVKYVNWVLKQKVVGASKTTLLSRLEASMFSNKPDHLVVYASTPSLLPILNVEVKKESKKMCTSKTVNGQIFDYIMVSKLIHGKNTFGVVTSFNESGVVWMVDANCDDEAGKQHRLSIKALDAIVDKVVVANKSGRLDVVSSLDSTPPTSPNSCDCPKSESPPSITDEAALAGSKSPHKERLSRSIRLSKDLYKPHQLFTVFCNAIFASLAMGVEKLKVSEDFETEGRLAKGDTVLRLAYTPKDKKKERGHEWLSLSTDLEVKGQWKVSEDRDLYVVRHLGMGRTSRVWQAVVVSDATTGECHACVVKCWVWVYDEEKRKCLHQSKLRPTHLVPPNGRLTTIGRFIKDGLTCWEGWDA